MADADALLVRKPNVAALEGANAHTDLGKSIRDALSDFSATGATATGVFNGVSPAVHSHDADSARAVFAIARTAIAIHVDLILLVLPTAGYRVIRRKR